MKELDRVFSIFIRLSYSDHAGYCECFTCGIKQDWREMQNGHFISRQHTSVRFDENNCRPQCQNCNEFKGGMNEAFEERLRDDLGDKAIDDLIKKGRTEGWYSNEEYTEIIHSYKLKIREMGVTI